MSYQDLEMFSGKKRPKSNAARPRFSGGAEPLESRCLLSAAPSPCAVPEANVFPQAGSSSIAEFTRALARTAYDFSQVSDTGAGQTIASVDAYSDSNSAADFDTFEKQFTLSAASLTVVSQTGDGVYSLYGNAASYPGSFRDLTTSGDGGGNLSCFGFGVRFSSGAISDLTTGLGSPIGSSQVNALTQTYTSASASFALQESPGGGLPFTAGLAHEVAILHDGSPAPAAVVGSETAETITAGPTLGTPLVLHANAPVPAPAANPVSQNVAISSVFSESLVHATGSSVARSAGALLDLTSAAGPITSTASTGTSGSIGSIQLVGGNLASWLVNEGESVIVVKLANTSAIAHSSAALAAAISSQTPGDLAVAAHHAVTQLMAPIASLPARIVYRFASFDPATTFADAMAAFAGESASVSTPQSDMHPSYRAWAITGVVLGADALMAARWYIGRRKNKKQTLTTDANGTQDDLLPAGL